MERLNDKFNLRTKSISPWVSKILKTTPRRDRLKKIIRDKTSPYFFQNNPELNYNLEVMKANYLLALDEFRNGGGFSSKQYFNQAVNQFKEMAKYKLSILDNSYIDKNSFDKFQNSEKEVERELNHYKRKLSRIAHEIGMDMESCLNLGFIKTFLNDNKDLFYKFL